jgi:hypothetical protein
MMLLQQALQQAVAASLAVTASRQETTMGVRTQTDPKT